MIKSCAVCGNQFETIYPNKVVCSFDCRQEMVRRSGLKAAEKRRNNRTRPPYLPSKRGVVIPCKPCVICGFDETTDLHHDKDGNYILCPNHHALITRGIKTIQDLLITAHKSGLSTVFGSTEQENAGS